MTTPAQYDAGTVAVANIGDELIDQHVPRPFQDQAREVLNKVAAQAAKAAIDAAAEAAPPAPTVFHL